jgi:RHS repeat-associated protein
VSFGVNAANELTTTAPSGTLTVAGTTTSPATNVTVWGSSGLPTNSAALYADRTWASTNATLPSGSVTYTALAKDSYGRLSTNSVTATIPSSASYAYDSNGNLLSDGTRSFAYDDENELVSAYVTNVWRSDFVYDGKMRRRQRIDYTWNGSAWVTNTSVFYLYDGNVVLQERNANNLPAVTYTRGRDLSGTLQGAGGIGGLLARTDNSVLDTLASYAHAFYQADGNGNVTCMINTSNSVVARYLYDPYGRVLSQSGLLAAANLYRFSSKEAHLNSGLVYYLYRFYDPNLQRWVNRDPIGELGGFNLYVYVGNGAAYLVDPYGLINWQQILQGTLTTIGGIGSIVVGGAATAGTGGLAVGLGVVAVFAGGTSVGLGITTIASGIADRGPAPTPTGTVPQGPVELCGAMTGSATLQQAGGYCDVGVCFATPPKWGGPLSLLNAGLAAIPPAPEGPGGDLLPIDPADFWNLGAP